MTQNKSADDASKRWWWPGAKWAIYAVLLALFVGTAIANGWREVGSNVWLSIIVIALIHEFWLDPFLKRHVDPKSDDR